MAACQHCGVDNPKDARFCGGCGHDLTIPAARARPSTGQSRRRRGTVRREPLRIDTALETEDEAPANADLSPVAKPPFSSLSGHPLMVEGEQALELPQEVLRSGVASERRLAEEPARALRFTMLAAGVLLLGVFAAPWSLADDQAFIWQQLRRLSALAFAQRALLIIGGVLLIASALLPLSMRVRALVAMVVGLAELGLRLPGASGRQVGLAMLLVLLPAALALRARSRGSRLARGLTALAVAGLLAQLLIPEQGTMPLLAGLSAPPTESLALFFKRLLPFALLGLSLLSLLVFLPRQSSAGAPLWAALLLLYLPLTSWLQAAALLGAGGLSLGGVHTGVVAWSCGACAALGLAQLAPRALEAS